MKRVLLMMGFCLSSWLTYAQQEFTDFVKPLHIPLVVNGTFGELRSNHFHSGIDFATQRKTGFPIVAVADGEINRIKVSPFGYGNVIYIRHDNGYTTVYAHLEKFEEPIATYVMNAHYKQMQSEIELFPLQGELKVKKNQVIAFSGNTGSSGGPHLHFEVRETQSEEIVNPYLLGMFTEVVDTQKPIINELYAYPKSSNDRVKGLNVPLPLDFKRAANGDYMVEKLFVSGNVSFGINSYDVLEKSFGKNGVYEIKMRVNGTLYTHVIFDKFAFHQSRYINHYIDYKRYKLKNSRVQKLFNTNNHDIPIFKQLRNEGFIEVKPGEDYQVVIEVSDFHKNTQIIRIPLSYKSYETIEPKQPEGKYIDYYRDYIFEEGNKYVEWKPNTFYEDVYLSIDFTEEEIILGTDEIPVHENIDIRFDVSSLAIDKEKTFIGKVDGKKIQYFETWKRENDFRIRSKTLGTYRLVEDSEPPLVHLKNNKTQFKSSERIVFEIEDELSGIGHYEAKINDQWVLLHYDYKTKTLYHDLNDGVAIKGNNNLILEIKDKMGNSTIFEYSFTLL